MDNNLISIEGHIVCNIGSVSRAFAQLGLSLGLERLVEAVVCQLAAFCINAACTGFCTGFPNKDVAAALQSASASNVSSKVLPQPSTNIL